MAQKIQRWLGLLAALLRRNYPIPFEELSRTSRATRTEAVTGTRGVTILALPPLVGPDG